ncbi:MAG: hypothetical protein ABI361_03385 [Nitrososphaera sp.]|jgi:hypothetical protein
MASAFAKKRKGIGNVITTLIILIASVVLVAGVVTLGGSMFQSSAQVQGIKVTNTHAWVNANGSSVTAFALQNIGGRMMVVDSVSVRGMQTAPSTWYSCSNPAACATQQNINTDLTTQYNPATGVKLADGTNYAMTPGTISLAQGQATIVYVKNAGNLSMTDLGVSYPVQIHTVDQVTSVQQTTVLSK